jgi:peptidoglycan LD-endopeptidase CwlK
MLVWRTIDPTTLRPPFRAAIELLFKDSPHRWIVTWGVRTAEQQNRLYGQGRTASQLALVGLDPRFAAPTLPKVTNATFGQSPHNFGLAIDVALDADPSTERLEPDWTPGPDDGWAWLKAQTPKTHPTLKGGWTFGDWPHIEWRNWRSERRRVG